MRVIPEVHDYNNEFYWKEIFPTSYKHRNITKITLEGSVYVFDGDIRLVNTPKRQYYCNCCGKSVSKWVPKLEGSLDTGKEIVYYCSNCGEGKFRIYSDTTEEWLYEHQCKDNTKIEDR